MNIQHIASAVGRTLSKQLPNILTGLAAVGLGATVFLTHKSSLKIDELLKENGDKEIEHDTAKEIIKLAAPAVGTAVVTMACFIAANRLSAVRIKALGGAYVALQHNFRDYKLAAASIAGTKMHDAIKEAAEEKNVKFDNTLGKDEDGELLHIFYDVFSRRQFVSTLKDVMEAEYRLNRHYFLRGGYASLNEFYEFVGLPRWEAGDELCWEIWEGETLYGYTWVDFVNAKHVNENGDIWYSIEFPFEPTLLEYEAF